MPEQENQKWAHRLLTTLNFTQYAAIVAIIASVAGQMLMLYLGAMKVYEAFNIYLAKPSLKQLDLPEHLSHSDVATALIIESLDAFLLAIVLSYFAFALFKLFIAPPYKEKSSAESESTHMTLGKLKETLAQVIVVVLFILFTRIVWLKLDNLQWEILILPISIALLALSIKLAKFK